MSAPFLWIYVFFSAGIIAGIHLIVPVWVLVAAAVCAGFSIRSSTFRIVFAAQGLFLFLLGQQLCTQSVAGYESNPLRRWVLAHEGEMVPVRGVVYRTPEIADDFFVFLMKVESIGNHAVSGIVRLTISGSSQKFPTVGDRIETFARFRCPRRFRAEGTYDYEEFLRKEGVHVLASVKNAMLIHTTGRQMSIRSWTSAIRLKWILAIQKHFDKGDAELLRALWLDDRAAMQLETERTLMNAGVFHVIAISGFHVAVLLAVGFLLLKRLLNYRAALILLGIFLLCYFLLLEGRSSITRAFIGFMIFAFASWRQERVQWSNVLCLSAFLQVCLSPLELFDVGYHLTYLSTAALVFFVAPLSARVRMPRKIYQIVFNFVTATVAVQTILLPYQAFVFHKVPFSSLMANAIAVPLTGALIVSGMLLLPFTWLARFGVYVLKPILHFFLSSCSFFSDMGLKVIPTPPLLMVVSAYACLVGVLIAKRTWIRFVAAACWVVLVVLILIPPARTAPGYLQLHFIDVGQGDAILLDLPDGSHDLIDGGGFWNPEALDIGESVLFPYLCSRGVQSLRHVFITHAHADHLSGIVSLMRYIPIEHLWITRKPLAEPLYQRLVRKRIPENIAAGKTFDQAGVKMRVLAPLDSRNTLHVQNDDSLVLLLEYQGFKVLFPGDAEQMTEDNLVNVQADFLKAAHHGSRTSSSEIFLDRVKMKGVFVSVGANNWFGHPHPEVLERFRKRHAIVYRTDSLGTILLSISQNGYRIDSWVWSH